MGGRRYTVELTRAQIEALCAAVVDADSLDDDRLMGTRADVAVLNTARARSRAYSALRKALGPADRYP